MGNLHKLVCDGIIVTGVTNTITEGSSGFEQLVCPEAQISKSFSKRFGKLLGGIVGFSMGETEAYADLIVKGATKLRDQSISLAVTLAHAAMVFASDGYVKLQTYLALIGAMPTVLNVEVDGQKAAAEYGLARNMFQWNVFAKTAGTGLKIISNGFKAIVPKFTFGRKNP
jgi:hypothetical protein